MKSILFLTSIFLCISVYAQEVQIIEKNENYTPKGGKIEKFEFISKNLNLTNHEKIAVLNGYSVNFGKSTLIGLFNTFWEMSNKFGANSYVIDKVERVSDTIYVQISVYYIDTAFEDNFKLYPKNMVYVFGDLDVKRGNIKKIKLNGKKVELAPLEYIETQNEVGKYATVSIGGFLGAKVDIYGREERLPVYLSLNGFGIGPGNFNQISISFNTGRIYPVEMNFGQFLLNILSKKE